MRAPQNTGEWLLRVNYSMIEEACLLSWSTTEANSTKPLQVVLRSPWGHAQCPFTVGEQRPFGGITAARTEFPRLPDVLPVNAMCHTELLVPEAPWPAFCCLAALMLVSCLGGHAWPIPVSGAVQKPVSSCQLVSTPHAMKTETHVSITRTTPWSQCNYKEAAEPPVLLTVTLFYSP